MSWCLMLVAALAVAASRLTQTAADECKLTPVVHVLQYPGCVPKPIPSYACVGHCTSYVQVRSLHGLGQGGACRHLGITTISRQSRMRRSVGNARAAVVWQQRRTNSNV